MEAAAEVSLSDPTLQGPPHSEDLRPPSDEAPDRVCILHVKPGGKSTKGKTQEVLPFSDSKWTIVQEAAQSRRAKPNFPACNYYSVAKNLPETQGERHGYHSSCYKNFTAIPVTTGTGDTGTSGDSCKPKEGLRSSTSTVTLSSTGIFPKECLFCGKERKKLKNGQVELTGSCETREAVKAYTRLLRY